jgi:type IX secretion system PorP/SprF family membrane protein
MITNKLKSLLLILSLMCVVLVSKAQQEPQYTQFMYNKLPFNAGYTGSRGVLSTRLLYRNQWVSKIDGAPQTIAFSIHSPFKKENNAMGLYVTNDRLGVTNQTSINITYAYRIPLTDKLRLNIGLNAGMMFYKSDLTELQRIDGTDEAYYQNVKRIVPEVGAGIYMVHPKFYVGVSSPNVIKSSMLSKDQSDLLAYNTRAAHHSPHLMVMAGGVIPVTKGFKIRPQVLGKTVIDKDVKVPFTTDFNVSFLIIDRINIGGTYRTAFHKKKTGLDNYDSVDANLEVWPTKSLMIGYAYDYSLTKLGNYNKGSHEVILGYEFYKKGDKIKTPRYF